LTYCRLFGRRLNDLCSLCETGMRPEEVYQIRKENVFTERRYLFIPVKSIKRRRSDSNRCIKVLQTPEPDPVGGLTDFNRLKPVLVISQRMNVPLLHSSPFKQALPTKIPTQAFTISRERPALARSVRLPQGDSGRIDAIRHGQRPST